MSAEPLRRSPAFEAQFLHCSPTGARQVDAHIGRNYNLRCLLTDALFAYLPCGRHSAAGRMLIRLARGAAGPMQTGSWECEQRGPSVAGSVAGQTCRPAARPIRHGHRSCPGAHEIWGQRYWEYPAAAAGGLRGRAIVHDRTERQAPCWIGILDGKTLFTTGSL